jgi:predicted RNase H-like HicB family nuclease
VLLRIGFEQETDGRWIAAVPELPCCMVYGTDRRDPSIRVQVLVLRVFADLLEHGELARWRT